MNLQGDAYAGATVAVAALTGSRQASGPSSASVAQAIDFLEALRQTQPLVPESSRAAERAAALVSQGTARARGLLPETAVRLVTSSRDLLSFVSGSYPSGKTAEIVVAADFRELHAGGDPGMRNAPASISKNLHDVRLSPDTASRRDLLFQVRARGGLLMVDGGQVKTGSGQYVSESLVKMAQTPGYGQTGYIDARYVNHDGTPRVAPDAFTVAQARRLREAGVILRGIRDLHERACQLVDNIVEHAHDGLDPLAREELLRLRDDIAGAYGAPGVVTRMASSAASAAATSALVNLVVQYASSGGIEVAQVSNAATGAALWGAGGVAADVVLYHAAAEMGLPPEAARAFAQRAVTTGFCLLAVAGDALAEARAVREGRASVADALSGGAFKTAFNLLPLVMPPLGLAGAPILAAIQVGGRWAIAALRQRDAALERAISEDLEAAAELHTRLSGMGKAISNLSAECDESDRVFQETMGRPARPQLRLVKGNGG